MTTFGHILLTHLPIVGTIGGTMLLLPGCIFKNNVVIKRTALGVFIISTLLIIPSLLTSGGADEIAKLLPGISENMIENREHYGEIFMITTMILGITAMLTFIADWANNKSAPLLYALVMVLAIGSALFIAEAGMNDESAIHTKSASHSANTETYSSLYK